MTRQAFMARLREGLAGLPAQTVADIVADYETHFADGVAAGRSEEDVAAALGDPGRLARELRAEAGLKAWEENRNPSGAAAAVFAVLGLGAIDILVLLPVLMGVAGAMFGIAVAVIAVFSACCALPLNRKPLEWPDDPRPRDDCRLGLPALRRDACGRRRHRRTRRADP